LSDRVRLILEALGAGLVIIAVWMISLPLGVFVAGVVVLLVANFYAVDDDDDADRTV